MAVNKAWVQDAPKHHASPEAIMPQVNSLPVLTATDVLLLLAAGTTGVVDCFSSGVDMLPRYSPQHHIVSALETAQV